MKARWRNLSEDRLSTSRREINSTDLFFEILSRLPTKYIAICCCVSKHWASILRGPDFTELFLTRSYARPQILFAGEDANGSELFFFSAPQLQNPDVNLSHVAANYYMKIPFDEYGEVFGHVHGLVCFKDKRIVEGKKETVRVICNPSTGESLTLPKVKTKSLSSEVRTSLGYDPIDKQYKVLLSMSSADNGNDIVFEEHQILTLGTGTWRMIECCIPYYYVFHQICINGVIYYSAVNRIVWFDVRSEKFGFIKTMKTSSCREIYSGTLTNYNGKLGILFSQECSYVRESIELWVLEDSEKQEWSKHRYVFPALGEDIATLWFVGVTRTNDIVMSTYDQTMPFYVFYYNIERKTVVRVEIQGMEAFKGKKGHIFLDHVEDVKLMGVV